MNRINGWAQIIAGATSNPDETKHLEQGVLRLQVLHTRVGTLSVQQAALTTAKQESTKELQKVLREGDSLADFIRTGARAHFGADSEKMIEFGMQPFRGLKTSEAKSKAPKSKAPETSEPEAGTPASDSPQ
jgi:hypothetical protein